MPMISLLGLLENNSIFKISAQQAGLRDYLFSIYEL